MRLPSALLLACSLSVWGHPPPVRTEVAPGVHLFRTAPYGEVGLDGNAVAVVGDDGVLVFDANGTPGAARAVVAELRRLTPLPVRFLVYSHWHWDHWFGAEAYREAFPGLVVVAQEATRRLMAGPAQAFNRPGLERDLPAYLAALERRLAALDPHDPAAADLRHRLEEGRAFLDQKRGAALVLPTLTFATELTVHLGHREVQVRHVDRAITPGDAFLYLPAERVLVTGDLLVNPVTFALSCYPAGWIRTLEALDALEAAVIVPGHGAPLKDKALLRSTLALLRDLRRRGAEAKARGLDPDQAREALLPELAPLRKAIVGEDAAADRTFPIYLVDWFLHRVYEELDGPLTDAIAPIPPK